MDLDRQPIIDGNLDLMLSNEYRGMYHLLGFESIGGNAGATNDGRPCVAANFYYEADTGKIRLFANYNYKDPELVKAEQELNHGTFKVAFDIKNTRMEIVNIIYDNDVSKFAKDVLELSRERYNSEKRWF